jgi:hypothetical protein
VIGASGLRNNDSLKMADWLPMPKSQHSWVRMLRLRHFNKEQQCLSATGIAILPLFHYRHLQNAILSSNSLLSGKNLDDLDSQLHVYSFIINLSLHINTQKL